MNTRDELMDKARKFLQSKVATSTDVSVKYLLNHLNQSSSSTSTQTSPPNFALVKPTVKQKRYNGIDITSLNGSAIETDLFFTLHHSYKKVCYSQHEIYHIGNDAYKLNLSVIIQPCNKEPSAFHGIVFDNNQIGESGASGEVFVSIGKIKFFQLPQNRVAYFEKTNLLLIKKVHLSMLDFTDEEIAKAEAGVMNTYLQTPYYARMRSPLIEPNDCAYLIMQRFNGNDLFNSIFKEKHDVLSLPNIGSSLLLLRLVLELFNSFKNQVDDFNLIHKDVKLENIIFVLTDLVFYFIDYEYSHSADVINNSTRVGTPGYIAPEIGSGEKLYSCDIYSLAIVLIQLLGAKFSQITKGTWRNFIFKKIDISTQAKEAFIDLIEEMMSKDPSDRPTIKTCIEAAAVNLLLEKTKGLSHTDTDAMIHVDDLAVQLLDEIDESLPHLLDDENALNRIESVLMSAIADQQFSDQKNCVQHFVEMLRIKELYGCNTKDELTERVRSVFHHYKSVLNEFNSQQTVKSDFLAKYKIIKPTFEYLDFIAVKLHQRKARVSKFSFLVDQEQPVASSMMHSHTVTNHHKRQKNT